MKKLVKNINEQTKQCNEVAFGIDTVWYLSQGYTEQDVDLSYNGNWYLLGYAPEKPTPTHDEISEARKQYRKENIDDLTARRSRKMAINDWEEADEAEYVSKVNEVETYIAENLPYPV